MYRELELQENEKGKFINYKITNLNNLEDKIKKLVKADLIRSFKWNIQI